MSGAWVGVLVVYAIGAGLWVVFTWVMADPILGVPDDPRRAVQLVFAAPVWPVVLLGR